MYFKKDGILGIYIFKGHKTFKGGQYLILL